ncbi:hypothetical protein F2Q68_00046192 [Brassica cretica]|uniref:Uncharacterized protein n=1 Tax=Brassica cretica TaxID=69181 RepID=A0A8S9LFX3_BRACR|nr:hypothetical protein F2Q68_00046192 [Brassica cretica]
MAATKMFFRSGFDMQVFQIWKTSGTTYLSLRCTAKTTKNDETADEYDDITDETRNINDGEPEFPVDAPPESSRRRVEFRW